MPSQRLTLQNVFLISVIQISKKHFVTFDFFVKMKLVLTVWVSTSLSKFGFAQAVGERVRLESITVVCKIVHKFGSVWCKTTLGEVSLP